jgi:formiminotetrahydrofolate cyclodeaminase
MELCARAIGLTRRAVGKTNRNVVSDLGVAALCLKAAVQSAWLNVQINLANIKDDGFTAEYREKGLAIVENALPIADETYAVVEAECRGGGG